MIISFFFFFPLRPAVGSVHDSKGTIFVGSVSFVRWTQNTVSPSSSIEQVEICLNIHHYGGSYMDHVSPWRGFLFQFCSSDLYRLWVIRQFQKITEFQFSLKKLSRRRVAFFTFFVKPYLTSKSQELKLDETNIIS